MISLFLLIILVALIVQKVGEVILLYIAHAIPMTAAGIVAWATWKGTHDLFATCAAGIAVLLLIGVVIEFAAQSNSRNLRLIAISCEFISATVVSALLAFMFLHAFQNPLATAITTACAGFIGFAASLSRRLPIIERSRVQAEAC